LPTGKVGFVLRTKNLSNFTRFQVRSSFERKKIFVQAKPQNEGNLYGFRGFAAMHDENFLFQNRIVLTAGQPNAAILILKIITCYDII